MRSFKILQISIVMSFLTIGSVYCQKNSEVSKIVLFRTYSFAEGIKILLNDSCLTQLRAGSFSYHNCESGEYTLLAEDISSDISLTISLEKNRTYYVRYIDEERVQEKGGRWRIIKPTLLLVDSTEALQIFNHENLSDLQNKNLWLRPKFHIDLFSNLGYGMQNTTMIYLTNGDKSTISFGEMYGGGLGLTYKCLKFFDMSTDLNICANHLRPDPNNVDVSFTVFRWSFTPYLVIPFDKGTSSLKIGIGKDF